MHQNGAALAEVAVEPKVEPTTTSIPNPMKSSHEAECLELIHLPALQPLGGHRPGRRHLGRIVMGVLDLVRRVRLVLSRIKNRLTPSSLALLELLLGYQVASMVSTAARLGIPDALKDGPMNVDELAARCGANPAALYRLLRALAMQGVFREVGARRFALTRIGRALRQDVDDSVRPMAVMMGQPWHWAPWGELEHAVRTGQCAFDKVHGRDLFAYLADDPRASRTFNNAMVSLTVQKARIVASVYDFSPFRTLVDIGGGHGMLIAAVLKGYPQLRGLVYDQPHVVASARRRLEAEGLLERCEIVGGDFFASVPEGGDAYVLSMILHDWSDEDCISILSNCRKVVGEGGRLLVVEAVIPEGNVWYYGKLFDVGMMVITGGQERTRAEYEHLLEASGFKLRRIYNTPLPLGVLEAVPV